ncbi:hypothetical protein CDAR_243881 [Caerostris darwini]|uniref:Uncharacterized protein n=1 Tax=Caerostris darwini TaxID=1538125 RepID=A0AAV4W4Y3_9ARAC|nr:hypothetical protein CDAR_243881 [Caerostris darwini]
MIIFKMFSFGIIDFAPISIVTSLLHFFLFFSCLNSFLKPGMNSILKLSIMFDPESTISSILYYATSIWNIQLKGHLDRSFFHLQYRISR